MIISRCSWFKSIWSSPDSTTLDAPSLLFVDGIRYENDGADSGKSMICGKVYAIMAGTMVIFQTWLWVYKNDESLLISFALKEHPYFVLLRSNTAESCPARCSDLRGMPYRNVHIWPLRRTVNDCGHPAWLSRMHRAHIASFAAWWYRRDAAIEGLLSRWMEFNALLGYWSDAEAADAWYRHQHIWYRTIFLQS